MSSVSSYTQWQSCRPDGRWEGTASVGGLTCGACAIDLEAEAARLPGLTQFSLNPASGLSHWVADDEQAIHTLQRRVQTMGYQFHGTEQSARTHALAANKKALRGLTLRWAIGLLCAMQIMMYAAPEYIHGTEEIGVQGIEILRWAQWVLVLPVVLYCARPFYARAWAALQAGHWSIDQPIVLGVSLAFIYGSVNLMALDKHVWFDSIAMLVTFLTLTQWLIERHRQAAVSQVLNMVPDLPDQVLMQVKGQWQEAAVSQLKAGQRFQLKQGLALPVDAKVPADSGPVWFDESMRTGESEPVRKNPGDSVEAGAKPLSALHNGGVVLEAMQSATTRGFLRELAVNQAKALSSKPVHQARLDRLIPWYASVVLLAAAVSGALWFMLSGSVDRAVSVSVAVLLVTCPCALALSWPLVRLFLLERFSVAGVRVAQPDSLEQLGQINAIAFDKTGTLAPVQRSTVNWQVNESALCRVGWSSQLAYSVAFFMAQGSDHPVARAVTQSLVGRSKLEMTMKCFNVIEVPGLGVSAVLSDSKTNQIFLARLGSADFCGASANTAIGSQVHFSIQCKKENDQANGLFEPLLLGAIEWGQPLMSRQTLDALTQMGVESHLLSGDRRSAVQSWAPELPFNARLAEQSAAEKADYIARLQSQGYKVLMLGDGLNDSVAFSRADVSMACQRSSAFSAQQANLLLTHDRVSEVARLILLARQANAIGEQNMKWALTYNVLGIGLAISGVLTPLMAAVGMVLSSLIVLMNSSRLTLNKG